MVVFAACTPSDPADRRIGRVLGTLGYAAVPDDTGDYRFSVILDDLREQEVWVRSTRHRAGKVTVREVFSVANVFPDGLPGGLAEDLLRDTWETRISGSWALAGKTSQGETLLVYIVRIDANAGRRTLKEAILEVAATADSLEAAISGTTDAL